MVFNIYKTKFLVPYHLQVNYFGDFFSFFTPRPFILIAKKPTTFNSSELLVRFTQLQIRQSNKNKKKQKKLNKFSSASNEPHFLQTTDFLPPSFCLSPQITAFFFVAAHDIHCKTVDTPLVHNVFRFIILAAEITIALHYYYFFIVLCTEKESRQTRGSAKFHCIKISSRMFTNRG